MKLIFQILRILTYLLLYSFQTGSSSWWYFSHFSESFLGNPKLLCVTIPNLHPTQRRMCRKRPDVILVIGKSTKEAIQDCQFHFRHHKWNCSIVERDSSVFGKNFIKGGTPELAFIQAITTANAVIRVSRACADGSAYCGCSLKTTEEDAYTGTEFKWSGCTESTKFALSFVRRFVDASEVDHRDPKARMTIYNNRAGRAGLLEHSTTRCKCHGLSGSCTMRSCWRFLPKLRTIGTTLKEKYDGAIKVEFDNRGQINTVQHLQKQPTKTNLIYFEDTQNGCVVDHSKGFFGTSGRECNPTSDGIDSCDILCCENGYETTRVSTTSQCNCTFHWCCNVTCHICHELKPVSRCKTKEIKLPEQQILSLLPVALSYDSSQNRIKVPNNKNKALGHWLQNSDEIDDAPSGNKSNSEPRASKYIFKENEQNGRRHKGNRQQ